MMYLLPEPQKWIREEGCYRIPYDGKIVLEISCTAEDYDTARILAEDLESYGGLHIAATRGVSGKTAISLGICSTLAREAYTLTVSLDGIRIVGGSSAGLFYGAATLRQMIRQAGAAIPCTRIEDAPAMEARGVYHDVTRGRIPTLDYLKKMADRLAFYKINQMQLYIEHSYLFENMSEVWRDDTPLTADDIMELDAYCRKLHIELVPSLSSFGHLYKLLRTYSYRHLCELPEEYKEPFSFAARMAHHTVDVTNPESMELVKRLILEYLPLFTSKHFNIGADETFDLGKGRSRLAAEEKGIQRLYIDFVKELCTFVIEQGKIPMFWGDIICQFPEAIKELPKETICLNWGYAADQSEKPTKALAQAGATQYCCPGVSGWNQLVNCLDIAYENIRRMCTYAVKYHAAGVLTTDWGDYGHINHPDFGIPGLIYGAAFSWNAHILAYDDINRQISRIEYLDDSESIVGIAAELSGCWAFEWRDAVTLREKMWADFRPEEIERVPEVMAKLEQIAGKLYDVIPHLPPQERGKVEAYLVAVRGMELLQKLGVVYTEQVYQVPQVIPVDARELAGCLEEWFYRYKEIWRTVSRESELYRLQETIFWYTDQLREGFTK